MFNYRNFFGCLQIDYHNAYLLINARTGLALQSIKRGRYFQLTFGQIDQNNMHQLWSFRNIQQDRFLIINAMFNRALTCNQDSLYLIKFGQINLQWIIDTHIPDKTLLKPCKLSKSYEICDNSNGQYENKPTIQYKPKSKANICDWRILRVQNNKLLNKTCFIQCSRTQKFISIPESTSTLGVSPILYYPESFMDQRFWIYKAGNVYVIKSFASKLNLDISEERNEGGVPIIQWVTNGQCNQFWCIQQKQDNLYRISSCINRNLELGHDGKSLFTIEGQNFLWRIIGNFIQNLQS